MKHLLLVCLMIVIAASLSRADEPMRVTNVRFTVDSGRVTIHYDLVAARDADVEIGLRLRRESERSFSYTPKLITGDIGHGKFAGIGRTIVWDSRKEFTAGLSGSDYYFEVTAEPAGRGGFPVPWIGLGAALVGGGVAAVLLLRSDKEQPPPSTGFPGPPGRP